MRRESSGKTTWVHRKKVSKLVLDLIGKVIRKRDCNAIEWVQEDKIKITYKFKLVQAYWICCQLRIELRIYLVCLTIQKVV